MKIRKIPSTIILIALMILSSVGVYAMPQMPHQFYGDVTIDGVAAPDGTIVEAKIAGVTYGLTTTLVGRYGWDPVFQVSSDDPDTTLVEGGVNGDSVAFYVGDILTTSHVFSVGGSDELDLAASTVPIETGTLSIDTTPVKGEVFVNGESWGTAPQSNEVDVGTYTVSFGVKSGFYTPGSVSATVLADTEKEVIGTYTVITSSDFSIDYVSADVVDKGDTLTVTGSGVTAGTTVNVFWDYASGTYAHLLNTTEGKPDGTFEVEIDVPSDYAGDHWLWVVDVSTGETISSDAITMVPKLSLSPSSGLAEDEVLIKGYGFTDEANFTALTFGAYTITETPGDIETDEDGYFEYTFDVPEDATYDEYTVTAVDFYGESASKTFILGASITLDPEEGPTGTKVEVEGRGYTDDATISFTMDGKTVHVVEDDVVTVESDGTFSAEIVIPGMDDVDEYEITATESGNEKGPGKEDFDVLGIQEITVDPTYGSPGATITVTGANFTQIEGTEVTVMIGTQILATAETESDGTFEDTFISPAIEFTTYNVIATDEDYDIVADDAFKVGLIVLIINPAEGEAGTKVSLTGIGFAEGEYNVTFTSSDSILTELSEEHGTITSAEALSDSYYVPNFEPGIYYLTVSDTDENELTVHFTVTATTNVVLDPAVAPNDYNVSVKGYNFADVEDGDVEFIIYNSTHEWDMDVYTTDPVKQTTVTDDDGNFTAWWEVKSDDYLSLGDYTVNVTGSKGILVQVPFSVVAARVSVAPRKAEFDRGDTIQFDINNDFILPSSYIEIYDPYETLYWSTDPFIDDWWLLVEGLQKVPYYRQTAAGNSMELQTDAPMGAWVYFFYDEDGDELMNGTFAVSLSTTAQVDEKLTDIWVSIEGLTDDISAITGELEADIGDLAEDIAKVISEMDDIKDEIVSDLAQDIADATQAGQAAQDAVDELADAMDDLGDAMTDIGDAANAAGDAAQEAADAANDAVNAAEDAGKAAKGLTGLVYGAIGASLIAALAAIVSLMQISRRIAG